jgi:hypothetical protein
MNAVVWSFLAGAVVGVLMFLMASEWIPRCIQYWRKANTAQKHQVRDALAPGDLQRWEKQQ